MKLKAWAASSADAEKMSATITGLMLALSAGGIMLLNYFGVPFTDGNWAALSTQFGLAAGALVTVYGAFRKVFLMFAKSE